jgi:hypothetical protein
MLLWKSLADIDINSLIFKVNSCFEESVVAIEINDFCGKQMDTMYAAFIVKIKTSSHYL